MIFTILPLDRESASSTRTRNVTTTRCSGRRTKFPAKHSTPLPVRVNTSAAGGIPVFVFNPLAWQRSGLATIEVQMPAAISGEPSVVDSQDRVLLSEVLASDLATNTYRLLVNMKDVPSMGYTVLHVVSSARPADLKATDLKVAGLTLENANLRVTSIQKQAASPASSISARTSSPWPAAPAAINCRLSKILRKITMPGTLTQVRSIT